jgi:hypothetical protein
VGQKRKRPVKAVGAGECPVDRRDRAGRIQVRRIGNQEPRPTVNGDKVGDLRRPRQLLYGRTEQLAEAEQRHRKAGHADQQRGAHQCDVESAVTHAVWNAASNRRRLHR